MARLDNSRWELFAQHVAAGMAGSRAYQAAGFTADGNAAEANASRLLRNAKVRARIMELQEQTASELMIDKKFVLRRVIRQLEVAESKGDQPNTYRALDMLAKYTGFYSAEEAEKQPSQPTREGNVVRPTWGQVRQNYGGKG